MGSESLAKGSRLGRQKGLAKVQWQWAGQGPLASEGPPQKGQQGPLASEGPPQMDQMDLRAGAAETGKDQKDPGPSCEGPRSTPKGPTKGTPTSTAYGL